MSSTSSSEQHWQNEQKHSRSYRNAYGRNPFQTTMGNPIICYTEVPQPVCVKQRGRKYQRDCPNRFVKAFRWYTEERGPIGNVSSNKPDVNFAAWLDNKYDQFLKENNVDSDLYRIKVNQTSKIEAEVCKIPYWEPFSSKKFFRVNSPWRKKRRAKSNETTQRSNQSFQYIMQPKDISSRDSNCCPPCSTVTDASDCAKIGSYVKSQGHSDTTIIKNKERARFPLEKEIETEIATQDFESQYIQQKPLKVNAGIQYGGNNSATLGSACTSANLSEKIRQCHCLQPDEKTDTHVSKNVNVDILKQQKTNQFLENPERLVQSLDRIPRNPFCRNVQNPRSKEVQRNMGPKKYKNVSCQCPEEKVEIVDNQTQYEGTGPAVSFQYKENVRHYPRPVQSTLKVLECPCERKVSCEWVTEQHAVQLSQKTAQTSSHSILLGKEAAHGYPFFMKIVCADKK